MRARLFPAVLLAVAGLAARTALQASEQGAGTPPASIGFTRVVYDANGRSPAVANYGGFGRDDQFTAYFYSTDTLCRGGGDSRERPATAAYGWEVIGRFLSRSPIAVTVRLDWRRMWEGGQPVAGPSGSVDVTLRPGDRLPIDHITAAPVPGQCSGVGMTLNVSFLPAGAPVIAGASGGGSGGGTSTGAGGTARAGAGGGGGRSSSSASSAASRIFSARGGGRSGGTAAGSMATRNPGQASASFTSESGNAEVHSDLDPASLQTVPVEVWLVHRQPNGAEGDAQDLYIQTTPGGGAFAFSPVAIAAAGGPATVEIKGFVQAQRPDAGGSLEVALLRRVVVTGPGVKRTTAVGASSRIIAMPGPGQVVAFEMPEHGSSVPLGGHQFSIRVRVRP